MLRANLPAYIERELSDMNYPRVTPGGFPENFSESSSDSSPDSSSYSSPDSLTTIPDWQDCGGKAQQHMMSGLVTHAANIKPPTMLAYSWASAEASSLVIEESFIDVSSGVVTELQSCMPWRSRSC